MDTAFERKKEDTVKYADLAAQCSSAGGKPTILPAEVGCRSFAGTFTERLPVSKGMTGTKLRTALKDRAEKAEQGSFWVCLLRTAPPTILRCFWHQRGKTPVKGGSPPPRLADDPAADFLALSEVLQAAMHANTPPRWGNPGCSHARWCC